MSSKKVKPVEATAEGEAPNKPAGPPVALIAMALIAAVGGGAGAYFLLPSDDKKSVHEEKTAASKDAHKPAKEKGHDEKKAAHGEKKKSDDKKEAGDEAADHFEVRGEVGYYAIPHLVVSIRPGGAARHLKLSLAIETSVDSEAAFLERSLRIRDALNTYLRAVEPSVVEDPSAMARLRAQIKRRIEFAAAPAPVHAVLITEFILS